MGRTTRDPLHGHAHRRGGRAVHTPSLGLEVWLYGAVDAQTPLWESGVFSVAVDGEVTPMGMLEKVGESSEVHFLPAIGGGQAAG